MTHLPFTLLAYFLNALSVLASKFLLAKTIPDPLIYIFYISLISFLAVLALPFTHIPNLTTFTLASFSTLFWTTGAYFMFKSLKLGQVSRVIPIIGTLIPLILLVLALEAQAISQTQTWAVWLLVAGMVSLTLPDWKGNLSKREIGFEILSAGFFAVSYVILRSAYLHLDFFSVIVWSRLILLPFGIVLLIIPKFRKKIITPAGPKINFLSPSGVIFLAGQVSGAVSEFLLLFSISLANPALVNSLQGTQYIFLLIFSLLLAKKYPSYFAEKYSLKVLASKLVGIIFIGSGLYFLAFS